MDPTIRQRFISILTEENLKDIEKTCSNHKNIFENIIIPNDLCIDELFDELKQFQFE